MAQTLRDAIRSWLGGVVLAGVSDRQIPFTSPHGLNSMLTNVVRGQSCSVSKRPGLQTVNQGNASVTNGTDKAIVGQFDYQNSAGHYHIYYLDTGHFGIIDSDIGHTGAFTELSTAGGLAIPDFATANNLCFGIGTAPFKFRFNNLENWGIAGPLGFPCTIADGGSAGVMTGTFEVRVTYYNTFTGHESSAGTTSNALTLSGRTMNITSIPVSADPQVTARKIYIRDTTTQTEFRLLTTLNDNVTTTYGANTDVGTLVVLGPNTTENDPPPAGVGHLAWVNSRMFVSVGSLLFWSKKGDPSSFDSTFVGEPINKEDGSNIKALIGYGEDLLIFKDRSIYILSGTTPESWRITPLFTDIGTVARWSIVEVGGTLYWWSHRGPVRWSGSGQPEMLGELLLGNAYNSPMSWTRQLENKIQAAVDTTNKLVLWTYPDWNSTRNNAILPFSYENDCFVASNWDPFDIASLTSAKSIAGETYVYAGNNNGQIFRFGTAYLDDGIPSGTKSGTYTASSTTSITNIPMAGLYTTGVGLKGRKVILEYASGPFKGLTYATREILSNNFLGFDIASLDVTAGDSFNVYIGGINFEWDTTDNDSGVPFSKKRYEWFNIAVGGTGANINFWFCMDQDIAKTGAQGLPSAGYYTFLADSSALGPTVKNYRVGKTGRTWRVHITHRLAGFNVRLDEVAMQSELLTGKLG